jgi:hypothetical protein
MTSEDAEMYAQATIAATLTLAVFSQGAAGHEPDQVVRRYKEVLDRLRAEKAWEYRGLDEEQAGG